MTIQAGGGSSGWGGGLRLYGHSNATYPGSVWIGRSLSSTGDIMFGTGGIGPGTVQMAISSAGNVTVSSGNLVMGTSGKGIDFSATANASGMTSELLADYEEGTWTCSFSGQTSTATGYYTKIGRQVTVWASFTGDTNAPSSGALLMGGLPFAVSSNCKSTGILFIQSGGSGTGNNVANFSNGVCVVIRPDLYIACSSTGSNSYYYEDLIKSGTVVVINFTYFV